MNTDVGRRFVIVPAWPQHTPTEDEEAEEATQRICCLHLSMYACMHACVCMRVITVGNQYVCIIYVRIYRNVM